MNVDVVSNILTIIPSVSASIVAIIGGLIASKLLFVGNERSAIQESLQNCNEEIDILKTRNEKLKDIIERDYAKDFIFAHMEELYKEYDLMCVYIDDADISFEVLKPYWNTALMVVREYKKSILPYPNAENKQALFDNYKQDDFAYSLLKQLSASGIESLFQSQSKATGAEFLKESYYPTKGLFHRDIGLELERNKCRVEDLEKEKHQLEQKLDTLKSPKGIKVGLLIFACFAITCIILPIVFLLFDVTKNISVAIVFVVLFIIGIAMIFIYLLYLLKERKSEKD